MVASHTPRLPAGLRLAAADATLDRFAPPVKLLRSPQPACEAEESEIRMTEEEWEAHVMAEDFAAFHTNEPGSAGAAAASHQRGVTIEFLLEFTRQHDCWHFPTWKVVQDILRPATRATRQRYADLAAVRRTGAVGQADTFVSHCWGALWGLLVSALADRADRHRRVWLDVFAVRQWAGNSADLHFASVVSRCRSFVICCLASPTKQIQGVNCLANLSNSEMLARRIDLVPVHIRAQISFLRAWCLVDVMSAIEAEKKDPRFAIVMKVGNINSHKSEEGLYSFQVRAEKPFRNTSPSPGTLAPQVENRRYSLRKRVGKVPGLDICGRSLWGRWAAVEAAYSPGSDPPQNRAYTPGSRSPVPDPYLHTRAYTPETSAYTPGPGSA